ncbi:MAG TPA: hypothetical protein VHJ82_06720 [Actinomycetota bacterium]|nr:hypothetical protein [Actinomycetota bacterium]
MRKLVVTVLVATLWLLPLPLARSVPPEGCEAVNPGMETCTLEITHPTTGPVSGVAGVGSWIVIVKRGKTKIKIKSPSSGEPTAVGQTFQTGDLITAKALTPGSGLVVGGE